MRSIFKRLFAKKEEPKEIYTVMPRWRSWEEAARDYDRMHQEFRNRPRLEVRDAQI